MAELWGEAEERAQVFSEIDRIVGQHVDEMEASCRLAEPVVAALRQVGAFRMPIPRQWGGPELPMLDIVDIIEELSYIEGAVGWCVMIGCDGGFYTAWLDDDVGRAMYKDIDAVTAGWIVPAGSAVPVEGGYRLSGRWSFGSGSSHADWFCSGALVTDTMEWRQFFVPAEEVQVVPGSWDTTGLRGTASNDYAIEDVFVPEERGFVLATQPKRAGALYGFRGTFAMKVAAVPIGLARRALDEVVALAERKIVMPQMTPLRELLTVQETVGRAEALIESSKAYFTESLAGLILESESGDEPSDAARRRAWLATSSAVQSCRQAVEMLAEAAGTDGIRRAGRLERIRRDLATASTHVVGRTFGICGRSLLGLDPGHPMF